MLKLLLFVAACGGPRPTDPIAVARTVMTSPCYTFEAEAPVGDVTEVTVREKHDASCGGDPDVAPTAARLRIHADGSVERVPAGG